MLLSTWWSRFAAFLLVIGIVLSPLHATAATPADLTASVSKIARTTTMRLGAPVPVRRHVEGTRTIAYDEVLDRDHDSTNLRIIETSRATACEPRDYDRSAKDADRQTLQGEGAICCAAATGIAAEGVGAATVEKGFFEGTQYTQKVLAQMKGGVGEFHSFPESVTAFENAGTVMTITGGDGVLRQMLEISGSYSGRDGAFQFIKEADGAINHRLFVLVRP